MYLNVDADADAAVPIPRFPNGCFNLSCDLGFLRGQKISTVK